jgi:trimeric autotransporter adhesin
MAYTKYSLTPANNNAAPPDGAPEGMLPSAVNDTMRDMMAQIRDVGDGVRNGTYTMTAPVITGGSITGVALSGNTLTNPVITGGSINNTPIGASTANTGAFTTLGASGVATFSAGTVSAPAITTTGDTNTGIYFPAADTIGFTEGGVEGLRINSSGQTSTSIAGTASLPSFTRTGDENTGIFFPAADTIAFTEGGVESMRIDSAGNVGVGTSTIVYKLEVNGAGRFNNSGAGGGSALFGNNLDSTLGQIIAPFNSAVFTIANTTANPIAFNTGGSEKMRITSAGDVGIGTSSPTYKLQIQSGASTILAGADSAATTLTDATQKVMRFGVPHYTNAEEPVGALFVSNTVSASALLIGGGTGQFNAATLLQFYTAANNTTVTGTERMRITSAGLVGIGTSSPSSTLTVGGNPPTAGALAAVGAAAGISLALSDNVNCSLYVRHPAAGPVIGTDGGNALRFATNGNAASDEKMRIDSSGNLLVGTTTTAGSVSNTANIVGGLFTTHSGTSGTIATGTPTNIITSLVTGGYYLVAVNGATNSTIYSMAYVYFDGGGTGNVTTIASVALTITSGSANAITLTTAGAGQAFSWSITRIK